jgi:hypothetical protein
MYGSYSCQESFLRWWQWGVWVLGNEVMASWTGKSHLNGVLCPVPRRERKGREEQVHHGKAAPTQASGNVAAMSRHEGRAKGWHHITNLKRGLG